MPFVTIASTVALDENYLQMIEEVCKTAWASMTNRKSGGGEVYEEDDVGGVATVEDGIHITGRLDDRDGICILFIYNDRGENFKQGLSAALEEKFAAARAQQKQTIRSDFWWCHITLLPTTPKLWFKNPSWAISPCDQIHTPHPWEA